VKRKRGTPVPLIEIRDLSHVYNRGTRLAVRALEQISVEVNAGEVVGILGANGSGKSTLLCHMNGIFKPQTGVVRVDGRSLADRSTDIRAVRRRVGLLFQNPEDQVFERFAGDDVAFGPRSLGLPREEVRRRVKEAMEAVGLPFAFKDRLTEELSRGQKRRIALAGILAMEPGLLVLDEPTANLDPAGRRDLIASLKGWVLGPAPRRPGRARERAVVIVSHSIDDIVELADRVYLLAAGRIVAEGPVREVLARRAVLAKNGIQTPFCASFMAELANRLNRPTVGAMTIDEAASAVAGLLKGNNRLQKSMGKARPSGDG